MKPLIKFLFMLFLALPLLFTFCGKDEIHELVGTWEYSGSSEGMAISISITFNSDNTGERSFTWTFEGETETESDNFTWSTDGNTLTITEKGETFSLKYNISGNKLTIEMDGEETVLTRK